MPTIAFASPKGGAGKSSSSILLGSDLAERGSTVTIIDADPNHPLVKWGKKNGRPAILTVIEANGEEQLVDAIEDAVRKTAFVIIDLEDAASSAVGVAMSRADLVIIPTKGSDLDAAEAVKAIKFIRFQERVYRREIPYCVLFTQTRPAIRPRTQMNIENELREQKTPNVSNPASRTRSIPGNLCVWRNTVWARSKAGEGNRRRARRCPEVRE